MLNKIVSNPKFAKPKKKEFKDWNTEWLDISWKYDGPVFRKISKTIVNTVSK